MVPRAATISALAQLLLLLRCALFAHAASFPFNAAEQKEMVDRHNELRREQGASNMNYVDWDDGLAARAQQRADSCVVQHDDGGQIGQFQTTGQSIYVSETDESDVRSGVDAINLWYWEIQGYNTDTFTCFVFPCGHYTQLVWAESIRIGCGRAYCPSLAQDKFSDRGWYVACNYGPSGNFVGENPFQKGSPCTACKSGSGQCDDGLCRPCSEHSGECVCRLECQNCGELVQESCTCNCADGFRGNNCSGICEDTHANCGANPGWPNADACSLGPYVPKGCPLMCGECNAPNPDFQCDPSQQTGSGSSGSSGGTAGSGGSGGSGSGGSGGSGKSQGGSGSVTGDICTQQFTAATYIDNELVLFHGGKLWRVSSTGQLLSPADGENAADRFIKLPNDISAVYQRSDGNVVFLRNRKMFVFNGRKRIDGHPFMISEQADSVLQGATHNRATGKTYLFKGPQVWRYDEASKSVDSGYPKSIEEVFDERLNKPNFVFSDAAGNMYFVKNRKVFRLTSGRTSPDSGYPKPFAPEFFSSC